MSFVNTNGLELARTFFSRTVLPALEKEAPEALKLAAFGLAGPGSECFGFDDELSRDHDWGPRVCIWIPEALHGEIGDRLEQLYRELEPREAGFGPAVKVDRSVRRDGVIAIETFLQTSIGTHRIPETTRDWLLVPEQGLALCTNGEVFLDESGTFTAMRDQLARYYPRDIALKKIASRCRAIGRIGQYDLWRGLIRDDRALTMLQVGLLAREIASIPYHLEGRYRPFDKWLFRGLLELGPKAATLHRLLQKLAVKPDGPGLKSAVPECIRAVSMILADRDLGGPAEIPMVDRAERIEEMIEDEELRNLTVAID
jgi:hypothetical protein